ncbi:histidinol-phosphate aminotransferase, partial [Streptomyces sp. DpondAA-F4a]
MTRVALVVGVGARRGVPAGEVLGLVIGALGAAGLRVRDVVALATLDVRAEEAGIDRGGGASRGAGAPVPGRGAGAGAGAEPVAGGAGRRGHRFGGGGRGAGGCGRFWWGGAGGSAELLVTKRKSASATCAVARGVRSIGTPASTNGAEPFTMAAMLPPTKHIDSAGPDLRHHGDAEVRGLDLTDLAVNVRTGTPPDWLRERIAASLGSLAAYPDGGPARAAVAERHGLPAERVLLTAGAAEAFVLLARAVPTRRPVVVHPQFTEPEAALRAAGHEVGR